MVGFNNCDVKDIWTIDFLPDRASWGDPSDLKTIEISHPSWRPTQWQARSKESGLVQNFRESPNEVTN